MTFAEYSAEPDRTVYRQCQLQRGNRRQVSWIPVRLAVKGAQLRLRTAAGWEPGWEVLEVYQHEHVDLHRAQQRFSRLLK